MLPVRFIQLKTQKVTLHDHVEVGVRTLQHTCKIARAAASLLHLPGQRGKSGLNIGSSHTLKDLAVEVLQGQCLQPVSSDPDVCRRV